MPALRRHQHRVHQHRIAFPLVPMAPDAARQIGAVAALDHHAFDHRIGRIGAQIGQMVPILDLQHGRQVDPVGPVLRRIFQAVSAVLEIHMAQILPILEQNVVYAQSGGMAGQQGFGRGLAVQPFLQIAEGGHLIAAPHQQFAVQGGVKLHRVDHIGEGGGNILSGPGIKPPNAVVRDRLHPNPVPFPFDAEILGPQIAQPVQVDRRRQHHGPERGERGGHGLFPALGPGEKLGIGRGQPMPKLFNLFHRDIAVLRHRNARQPGRDANPHAARRQFQIGIAFGGRHLVQPGGDHARQGGAAGRHQLLDQIGQVGRVAARALGPDQRHRLGQVPNKVVGQRKQRLVHPVRRKAAQKRGRDMAQLQLSGQGGQGIAAFRIGARGDEIAQQGDLAVAGGGKGQAFQKIGKGFHVTRPRLRSRPAVGAARPFASSRTSASARLRGHG